MNIICFPFYHDRQNEYGRNTYEIAGQNEYPRPGLTPGTALRAVGSRMKIIRTFIILFLFYFISFIGHRNSRLQDEHPMGLVQTGKRDPCKAQPLNKSMTR
jgi:hypothetical protein